MLTLNHTINAILAEPETIEALKKIVIEPQPMTTDAFFDFMAAERKKWGEIIQKRGIKVVTNMGAANPLAAGERMRALAVERDLQVMGKLVTTVGVPKE